MNALLELLSAGANPHPAPPRVSDPVGAAAAQSKKAVKKKRCYVVALGLKTQFFNFSSDFIPQQAQPGPPARRRSIGQR